MKLIRSESRIVLETIVGIVKMPFLLLLALFGKRQIRDAFTFVDSAVGFFFEPKGTLSIVFANTVVFLFIIIVQPSNLEQFVWHSSDLFGATIWRMFSAMFLHASILHLLGNMLFLYILGRVVEKELGTFRFLFVYFVAGIVSFAVDALVQVFIYHQTTTAVGASGAISGIAILALLLRPLYFTYLLGGIPLPIVIVVFLQMISDVIGVFVPKNTGIGYFAHVAGYLSVFITCLFLPQKTRQKLVKGFWLSTILIVVVGAAYYFFTLHNPQFFYR